VNFALIQHHKWSLTELDNMIPFERQLYVEMLSNWIEKENERLEEQNKQRGY
tara:strand:- start:2833 stop:2988 length:156 start_codon:yes stop_codon:yes gene_type:complete